MLTLMVGLPAFGGGAMLEPLATAAPRRLPDASRESEPENVGTRRGDSTRRDGAERW